MCAYKLVTFEFKWWGLQTRIEKFIGGVSCGKCCGKKYVYVQVYPRLFTKFHREVVCWTDSWHGMTMADIRELEEKVKHQLDEDRRRGSIKGIKGHD